MRKWEEFNRNLNFAGYEWICDGCGERFNWFKTRLCPTCMKCRRKKVKRLKRMRALRSLGEWA